MALDPASVAAAISAAKARSRSDPLLTFHWPSEVHSCWASYIRQRIEAYLRAANKGAKTYSGAAVAVAIARGLPSLDGVALPSLPVPNVGAVAVRSYGQQVDSSQSAIFHWLGDWPHDVGWINRALNYAGTIYVATARCKHGTGENCATCSRIVFVSQENADKALGARWDWAWGDEPPIEPVWREIRKNCRLRWITATPLARSEWEWLQKDFLIAQGSPVDGRVELVANLFDNKFLSDQEKRELIASYAGDPFARARIHGEYVDAEGATPWGDLGFQRLQAMLEQTRPGTIYEFPLAAAHRSAEKVAKLEVWWDPEDDETYYACVDASLGISDDGMESGKKAKRDPSGLHVYARRKPRLVARYGGFLVPEVLGHFGAKVGEMYRNALSDVENQGGYGEAVLAGYHHAGYRHVLGGDARPSQANAKHALAFETSAVTRGLYIGAFQDLILHGGIEMPSAEVIRSALGMRVDNTGKLLARSGLHDEDVMLAGRAAYWMARKPAPMIVRREPLDYIAEQRDKALLQARRGTSKKRETEAWD